MIGYGVRLTLETSSIGLMHQAQIQAPKLFMQDAQILISKSFRVLVCPIRRTGRGGGAGNTSQIYLMTEKR